MNRWPQMDAKTLATKLMLDAVQRVNRSAEDTDQFIGASVVILVRDLDGGTVAMCGGGLAEGTESADKFATIVQKAVTDWCQQLHDRKLIRLDLDLDPISSKVPKGEN